jgi:hypothetical protein
MLCPGNHGEGRGRKEPTLCLRIDILWSMDNPMPEITVRGLRISVLFKWFYLMPSDLAAAMRLTSSAWGTLTSPRYMYCSSRSKSRLLMS